ncbi:hypothetical protein C1H46_021045 [Malus baccata]|uniref:Uncharacterized protein n=1 Tax=Malus baccata TaxID=106549 RepID=A0A540M3X6_MALBA|nr:hypothetical protein C1H46_021045 [Malus baccata]
MAEMKTVVRCLLDLPMEMKIQNKDVIAGSGYVAASMRLWVFMTWELGSSQAVHSFCSRLDASSHQRRV